MAVMFFAAADSAAWQLADDSEPTTRAFHRMHVLINSNAMRADRTNRTIPKPEAL